ncbi:MAG: hypothetical protein EOO88_18715 [Pedobacter sp.]|nr:MAG: hypothetical protein EOO88_18715 [Pedobacter sp.]
MDSPLFDDFDYWSAFEAGHFYGKTDEANAIIARMKALVIHGGQLDCILWGHGEGFKESAQIPYVGYEASSKGYSPKELEAAMSDNWVWFADYYDHEKDGSDPAWRECGNFPFDMNLIARNLDLLESMPNKKIKRS